MPVRTSSCLGVLALALGLAAGGCRPAGQRTPLGLFDTYAAPGRTPDSRPQMSLYYKRRLLTNRYGTAALDPRNAGRIAFSGDTEFNSEKDPCGTFLFDAATGRQERIAAWPDNLGVWTWAPDGRKILLLGSAGVFPEVLDLDTRESAPLAAALSQDGRQLEVRALGWSPDSRKVAAVIHLQRDPNQRTPEEDWDLIEITLSPLSAAYVATMHARNAIWEPTEYRWQDGVLAPVGAGRRFPIFRKADEEIGWTTTAPETVTRSPSSPCSQ